LVEEKHKSLYAHCFEYMQSLELSVAETIIAAALIEDLQPTGWIESDLKVVAQKANTNEEAVNSVLERLQDIEPAGLFARSLKECLILQRKTKISIAKIWK
jgi:RNA polymerase sigma-54 factor